ncbi:hypothetical protein F5Y12DRAFT_771542 [Xylaria sp. FL1777]|nr:hypothetical protein F5Y12DRAFT_771542 [Xylaria sp. FL1777]
MSVMMRGVRKFKQVWKFQNKRKPSRPFAIQATTSPCNIDNPNMKCAIILLIVTVCRISISYLAVTASNALTTRSTNSIFLLFTPRAFVLVNGSLNFCVCRHVGKSGTTKVARKDRDGFFF